MELVNKGYDVGVGIQPFAPEELDVKHSVILCWLEEGKREFSEQDLLDIARDGAKMVIYIMLRGSGVSEDESVELSGKISLRLGYDEIRLFAQRIENLQTGTLTLMKRIYSFVTEHDKVTPEEKEILLRASGIIIEKDKNMGTENDNAVTVDPEKVKTFENRIDKSFAVNPNSGMSLRMIDKRYNNENLPKDALMSSLKKLGFEEREGVWCRVSKCGASPAADKQAKPAKGGMRTKPEAGAGEEGRKGAPDSRKFLITPEGWLDKLAPRRPYIPVKGQFEESSAGAFSVPVKYALPEGPRITVTEQPEEALKIPVSRADSMNRQNLTAWSLALSPQELRESIRELERLITDAESASRSMTQELQGVADQKRRRELVKSQGELEGMIPILTEQLRAATRELARKEGDFTTPEGLEPGGSPEEFEAPATEPQDQAKGLRRLMKANREKTGAQGADGDVSKTPEQDIAPVNPDDQAEGLRAEAALRKQHAANVEATKDHPLIRILDYAVQSGRGYGPDSETLSMTELNNIYRTVALLNDSHIEIYVPQSFGLTKMMKDALKDIGKKQNKETVRLREFSDEKHLLDLLKEKPVPGVKRIVLTEAINKNALASALAYALQRGDRDILDSFRSLKLLSVSFFKEYEGMRSEEKTAHQAKLMNIAILASLFREGDTAVGAFLRDMLKSCFGDDAASIDAVMKELGMPDERLNSLAVEDLIDRFARLLARPISLVERIGQEIRLMKNFLIAA
ncbi:MAG: hypothetical protein NTY34_00705, partial [Candidatus Omnitrophica bacterium]|nr:hypothetical protein [Candidatus Omnitrophota bacterium]